MMTAGKLIKELQKLPPDSEILGNVTGFDPKQKIEWGDANRPGRYAPGRILLHVAREGLS